MRPSAKKLLSQLVQEAFSYELSLNRPVDPIGGSNATIEQNPEAVQKLLNPEEGKRLLEEAYSKMSVYAKYEFLTPVGYHGLVNSAGIGAGILTSMETLDLSGELPSVNFETLLSTNEDVKRAWMNGAIAEGLSDDNYEKALRTLSSECFSFADLTGDFNRSTFERYLTWGRLWAGDPFKTLLNEWGGLDGDGRHVRLTTLKESVLDRLTGLEDATPIWRAECTPDILEACFTSRVGEIEESLREYENTSPCRSFFRESSEALFELLKENNYDADVLDNFEAIVKRLKHLSDVVYPRDYISEAKCFQEHGRALLRAYLLKRFGVGLNVSQEDLDDFYHYGNDKPKPTRHTQLPLSVQNLEGITGELNALFAAIQNLGLSDAELALAEKIYSTDTFYRDFIAGKFDDLKEIDQSWFETIRKSFIHHQTENASFYEVLSDLIRGKGLVVDYSTAFWGWVEAGKNSNDTMVKALRQFESGHAEFGSPCFELSERALERAKRFPYYDKFAERGGKLFKDPKITNPGLFEELCEKYVDNSEQLAGLFIPAGMSLSDCKDWLERESNATREMHYNHREYVKSTDGSVSKIYSVYTDFLAKLKSFLTTGSHMFGAIACSVRNVRRTKINLLEIIFKARAGEFSMEGLEEELGVEQLLLEGAKYSEEGIIDFLKKVFKVEKKRPEKAELYLEVLEKESKGWKNPSALALIKGGVREVPEELMAKLRAIAKDNFSPSMWRSAKLKKFYDFACRCNDIEDIGSTSYEELEQANNTKEVLEVVDRVRKNIKAFLELCKQCGIDTKQRPEFVAMADVELYRDVTSNMNASMAMLERGWSSREGGSWLLHETKYYGWFAAGLEDGETNSVIDELDEDELSDIQTEISNLVAKLRKHFDWVHHPIYDIECYIVEARLEVLKYAERIEEGKIPNLVMESVDDEEVVRLLSQGVTVSQEGFLELVRKLFAKKPEKPDKKLERLEQESKSWKKPEARALVDGSATKLPEVLEKRLVALSKKESAPCQWLSKELKPFLDFYIEAANTLVDYDQGFYDELKEAKDRKAVEDVLKRARVNIATHIALAKKHNMSLEREPKYVEVPVHELYLDLTKRFADSVKLVEKSHGKSGYFLVYSIQYYGWFFAILDGLDSEGFEDFSEDETDKIRDEFSELEDELDNLFDWGCAPDDDIRNFLKKGRLLLLEAGDAIERGKEIVLSMEGFVGDLISRLTGKKTHAAKPAEKPAEPAGPQRPDKMGFGYDDGYDAAEEFLEKTKYRGGNYDIEKLCDVKFQLPAGLLANPVANRNKIIHWFEVNQPGTKEMVLAYYEVFEERTLTPDTAVLPVWVSNKHPRLVRLWSQVGKEIAKYPYKDPTPADFKNIVHFWAHNGFAELAKSELKTDDLKQYRYGDLLDDLFDPSKKITIEDYEKAATGNNPLYAQIGNFNTYRWWATANVIGEENFACSALFGKLEDKYCSVEFEWRTVLANLIVLSWHIGNLSGKRA